MQITRSELDTTKGPADWFTGDVYVDTGVGAPAPAGSQGGLVHFTPGARTVWHSHPLGQTIFVTEGVGRCQRRGGQVEEIRPGDRVFFEPDEDHWHGAAIRRTGHRADARKPLRQGLDLAPEIAQALFVTPKTVATHLAHTYQKLDIHTRIELANTLSQLH